jgi:hypothetical protein
MNTVDAPATVGPMPARKRPLDRKNRRVTIEVYEDDEEVWHRVRVAAAEERVSVRELVTAVMRDWLEREERRRDA